MWFFSEDLSCKLSHQPCVPSAAAGIPKQTCLLPRGVPGLLSVLLAPRPVGRWSIRVLSVLPPVPPQLQCPGQYSLTDSTPLLSSPTLPAPAKGMSKGKGQGAPQEQRAPWGSARSSQGALGWIHKKTEGGTISQCCNYSREVLKWDDEC